MLAGRGGRRAGGARRRARGRELALAPATPTCSSGSASRTSCAGARPADASFLPRSEAALRRALRGAPDEPNAVLGLGSLALIRHEFRALALGRRAAAAARPGSARPYGVIGDALVELGRYDGGVRAPSSDGVAAPEPRLVRARRVRAGADRRSRRARSRRCGSRSRRPAGSPSRPRGRSSSSRSSSCARPPRGCDGTCGARCASFPGYPRARSSCARVESPAGRTRAATAAARRRRRRVPTLESVTLLARSARAVGPDATRRARSAAHGPGDRAAPARERRPRSISSRRCTAPISGSRPAETVALARRARAARPSIYGDDALAWALARAGPLRRGARVVEPRAAARHEGSAPLLPPRLRGGLRRATVPRCARGTRARSRSTRRSRSAGRLSRAARLVPELVRQRAQRLSHPYRSAPFGATRPECDGRGMRRARPDRGVAGHRRSPRARRLRRRRRGAPTAPTTTTTQTETDAAAAAATTATAASTGARRPRRCASASADGVPAGGVVRESTDKGDRVVVVVTSDVTDHVHVHGYDLLRDVAPGAPARIAFRATIPGRFEIELEDRARPDRGADRQPVMAPLAHGIGGVRDLPVPRFVLLRGAARSSSSSRSSPSASLWPTPQLERRSGGRLACARARPRLPRPARSASSSQAISVACSSSSRSGPALCGTTLPLENFAPTFVYVAFWLGIPLLSVLFGNVWSVLSPVARDRRLLRLAARARRKGGDAAVRRTRSASAAIRPRWRSSPSSRSSSRTRARPTRACSASRSRSTRTGRSPGMAVYGREAWTQRRGGLRGRVRAPRPHRAVHDAGRADRRSAGRSPGSPAPIARSATLAVVAVLLGSTSFDGFSRTTIWQDLLGERPRGRSSARRRGASTSPSRSSTWPGCSAFVARGRRHVPRCDRVVARRLVQPATRSLVPEFLLSLVPIAFAYLARALLLAVRHPGPVPDPARVRPVRSRLESLRDGRLRARTSRSCRRRPSGTCSGVGLVVGHVAGLAIAHDRAVALFPRRADALRSQYPMLVLMVLFTVGGLWLLNRVIAAVLAHGGVAGGDRRGAPSRWPSSACSSAVWLRERSARRQADDGAGAQGLRPE